MDGRSVQYASASGSTWQITALSGSIGAPFSTEGIEVLTDEKG